ncbi:MAG: AAA family ATPase [Methanotrichaceae archaeon]|nr:AAA family ATPase [Methanotrichaceae archaeon]
MRITVSGAPGTGTTTLARRLSRELDLPWVNSGDLFRRIAAERGISVRELNRLAERGPEIDYLIDDAMKEAAAGGEGVFEGRLAGHILEADLKILLKGDIKTRSSRIGMREEKLFDDALMESRAREASEARRYMKYYNIDIGNFDVYHLVIDTVRWNERGCQEIALAAVRSLE